MTDKSPQQWTALIPLRGGSKGLPCKNLALLGGVPLCAWAIRAAIESRVFDGVWVSTEDDEIARVAERFGAQVHRRPPALATDSASTEDVMQDFLDARGTERGVLALIQATSPFTRTEDLREARARFDAEGADSLLSAVREHRFRWNAESQPLNYDPAKRPRRQDWAGEWVESGAFYFTRVEQFARSRCRVGGRILLHELDASRALEIDSAEDLAAARAMLPLLAPGHHPAAGPPIRLFVMDVDGVLTDAGFYYSETGEALKKFSTRDGQGIVNLRKAGIELGIITGERSGFSTARTEKLGIERLERGCTDKLPVLDAWRRELGLDWSEVAYMGDDLPDIPCLREAGAAACPSDAEPEVIAAAGIVTLTPGGRGCVREFIRILQRAGRVPLP